MTGKPVDPNHTLDEILDRRTITRLRDFPFYPLLADRHPEKWKGGRRCIPVNTR